MCVCVWAQKGSLCLHGPGAKCVHCIVPDDPLNRKHVSFEEFMAEEKSKCKHAPSYDHPAHYSVRLLASPVVMCV